MFRRLLPRALAWRAVAQSRLREFFDGLDAFVAEVREFVDLVYLDLLPTTTRELDAWERQFALPSTGTDANRRLRLAGAWAMQGGQSPDYIQTVLHAAGFTSVFIHEWWASTGPLVARDPRDFTDQPLIGQYQCEASSPWECYNTLPGKPLAPHCDDILINDPGYIVNLDLTRRAPPPVPDDPTKWPYFLYFAGEEFPDPADVDELRVAELKELLLRICPAQQWIVLILNPIEAFGGFGASEFGAEGEGS